MNAILEAVEAKKRGEAGELVVFGCLAQRYAAELPREVPEVDAWFGARDLSPVLRHLGVQPGPAVTRRLSEAKGYAYLKISEGCDRRCSYCAIPFIRGAHRSVPMEDLVAEAEGLAARGVRELILIAQDTTRYGKDIGDSLNHLLTEAVKTEGLSWLRVLYMYPDELDGQVLSTMASNDVFTRYLDLPLQHASEPLLKKMNRRGTMAHTREMLKTARDMGFCLRTTFIVGFPGETEEDFERLMDFTEEIGFDRMGAFAFSPEEDTPAFSMPDQVPEEVKQERLDRLMRLQAKISLSRNQARVGAVEKVLVTGTTASGYTGRSAFEAPDADGVIRLTSARPLTEGTFVQARLTGADTYDLTGEVI